MKNETKPRVRWWFGKKREADLCAVGGSVRIYWCCVVYACNNWSFWWNKWNPIVSSHAECARRTENQMEMDRMPDSNATTVLTVYEADCCEEMQYIHFDYFIGTDSVQFDSVWQQRKSTADCIRIRHCFCSCGCCRRASTGEQFTTFWVKIYVFFCISVSYLG